MTNKARADRWTPASLGCGSAWWSVGRFGFSVILLTALFSLIAIPWVDLRWWRIVRRCASIAAACSLWWCIRRLERRRFADYGLRWSREARRMTLVGAVAGAGALGILLAVGLAAGVYDIALTPDRAKLWGTVLGFIPGAALVAVLEELVFRGYLLQHWLGCSRWLALVASSAVYAIVHIKTREFGGSLGMEITGLFVLGVVLALTVLWTHQLWLAIGLHAALAYGAQVNRLVIAIPNSSLTWLVGSNRLINGVAAWAALGLLAGIVWWWTHRTQQGGQAHAAH